MVSSIGNKIVFSRNLRELMRQRGKDRKQVCADLGFKYTTFTDWYNGNKYPRIDKIEMLADYFGVLKSDLIEDKSDLPSSVIPIDTSKGNIIPILGRIAAGLPLYAEQNIEGYTLTDLNGGAEYFALRVNGDSMNAARIEDGDLIIVRRQEEVENGELAVVMVGDDDATVKRFYVANNTVTLMPQSTNSKHQPQIYDLKKTKIRVLGKVIEIKIMAK